MFFFLFVCLPFWQDPAYSLLVENRFILLDHNKLQQHFRYAVDVQAKMCPGNIYQGPWSEWSPSAEWRTTETSVETEGSRTVYHSHMLFFYTLNYLTGVCFCIGS